MGVSYERGTPVLVARAHVRAMAPTSSRGGLRQLLVAQLGTALNLKHLHYINVQWFRGGLVFKARRLCVSLNSRLGSNVEEEERMCHPTCARATSSFSSSSLLSLQVLAGPCALS